MSSTANLTSPCPYSVLLTFFAVLSSYSSFYTLAESRGPYEQRRCYGAWDRQWRHTEIACYTVYDICAFRVDRITGNLHRLWQVSTDAGCLPACNLLPLSKTANHRSHTRVAPRCWDIQISKQSTTSIYHSNLRNGTARNFRLPYR